MIHRLTDSHTIAHRYLSELRHIDIQTDRNKFRNNMERLGMIFGYEISRHLNYESIDIPTSLGIKKSQIPTTSIVLATILRAGLPLHNGLLQVFDDADCAFAAAYRKHSEDGSFHISEEYITCPDLNDITLIISDPMLATGASLDAVIQSFLSYGKPQNIHIVTVIASTAGIEHIATHYPDTHLWVGDEDETLNNLKYIVPGLGDAGDLSYGMKQQS